MVEHIFGELLSHRTGQVGPEPFGIETSLVHTHKTDGGKVIVELAEIPFGIGIKSFFQQFGNDFTLDLERSCRNIHHMVEPGIEILLVFSQIGDTGDIDSDHTD